MQAMVGDFWDPSYLALCIAYCRIASRLLPAFHGFPLVAVLGLRTAHQHRLRDHLLRPFHDLCHFDRIILAFRHGPRQRCREAANRVRRFCFTGLPGWLVSYHGTPESISH